MGYLYSAEASPHKMLVKGKSTLQWRKLTGHLLNQVIKVNVTSAVTRRHPVSPNWIRTQHSPITFLTNRCNQNLIMRKHQTNPK